MSRVRSLLHVIWIGFVCGLASVVLAGEAHAFGPLGYAETRHFRSIDGSDNHRVDAEMGSAGSSLVRWLTPDYADGVASMSGELRPSPRAISNAVVAGPIIPEGALQASDFLWQWGQFLDHDLDLTDPHKPEEPAPIPVPTGDPHFDPAGAGDQSIEFNRSLHRTDSFGVRQQINEVTSWIDASNVYGSDAARAAALRAFDGTGRLKTSPGGFLPFNTAGMSNAGGDGPDLFLAGDVRANEQVGLTALHTLFVREHNRLAAEFRRMHPRWSGERIYQEARRVVGAQMQVITYREFLPALLGPGALSPYTGYDRHADGRIANVFSGAAYRFGHSALSPRLMRIDRDGSESRFGHLALRDAFFSPMRILDEGGIEPILRGLAAQLCQPVDGVLVDDVRNFLFGAPGSGGFDLASLNIQRGRDHGLPSYNDTREQLGLSRTRNWADVTADPQVQAKLAAVYRDVDEIDLWVGGLAEDRVPRSHLGSTFHTILVRQFEAVRDADRHWYKRSLSAWQVYGVERTRLSQIIRRNTTIGSELPHDVFRVEE